MSHIGAVWIGHLHLQFCVFWLLLFFFFSTWTVISYGFTVHETKITIHESYSTIHTLKNYFATIFSVLIKISYIQTDSISSYLVQEKWQVAKIKALSNITECHPRIAQILATKIILYIGRYFRNGLGSETQLHRVIYFFTFTYFLYWMIEI